MQVSELEGRYSVEDVGRIYTNQDDLWLPSVSTVLDVRETPDALRRWKKRTDDPEAVLAYKQDFGTIAHAELLQNVIDEYPSGTDETLWGKDEDASRAGLKERGEWKRCQDDLAVLDSMWTLCKEVMPIGYIHDVETFVIETDIGYGGQFDLLYEDTDSGETVLADLKTSKGVYEKHLMQLSAYRMAVPINVDRMEVIRLNPEREDWRVFPDTEWTQCPSDLAAEFINLRAELERTHLKTIIETVQEHDGASSDELQSREGVMYEPVSF